MSNFVMGNQFRGLPMGDLIGGPLTAACDAQVRLANATAEFIKVVGFLPPQDAEGSDPNGVGDVRTVSFRFDRPSAAPAADGGTAMERVELEVPLLSVVKVPNLAINNVGITFDMEVKHSENLRDASSAQAAMSAEAKVGWGPFSAKVNISGSVSSHKEHTRSTDHSARYHVELNATDSGMPEGLARVMDLISQSVAPRAITQLGDSSAA
ncbi:DUF2589 domain-containing protein [Pseudomonas sp. NPDC089406]|uniref:DUF2589 domain-containing protein n=1 Tax=Pseudomonas sp. NPDC089406 TaxID=3364463 RepID=UPI00384EA04B